MNQQPASAADSTIEVLRRLAADVAALIDIYRREVSAHFGGLARDALTVLLLVGAALVLGVFALGLAVATVVLVLAIWLPAWLAALAVLAVTVAAMAVLVLIGVVRVRRRRAAWRRRVSEEVRWLRSLFPTES